MPDGIVKIELTEPLTAFVQEQTAYEAEIDAKILDALCSDRPGTLVTPAFWEEKRARLKARLEEARRNNERSTNG